MPWTFTEPLPDALKVIFSKVFAQVHDTPQFQVCHQFASLTLGHSCTQPHTQVSKSLLATINPSNPTLLHRRCNPSFQLAQSTADSQSTSDWTSDDAEYVGRHLNTGFRGFLVSCLAASIDNTASQVTQLTMGPSMVWRMPFLIAAAYSCVKAYLTHPRTCVVCHKQWFWVDGPVSAARCWQCNRAFHEKCLQRLGIEGPDPDDRFEPWYHSPACQLVSWNVYQTMREGPFKVPNTRAYTCQIAINTKYADPSLPTGLGVNGWEFFREHFPDFRVPREDPLMYALLRHHGRLVSAAVLEVFGQDLAHIKFVVTDARQRKQGHYLALQRGLEHWLTKAGVRQLLVTSRPEAQGLWPKLGFRPLQDPELLNELEEEFGADLAMGEGNFVFVKEPGVWEGEGADLQIAAAQLQRVVP